MRLFFAFFLLSTMVYAFDQPLDGFAASQMYNVYVNGEKLFVARTDTFDFCSVDVDSVLHVRIETAQDLRWVDIRPKFDNIDFDYTNHSISFHLDAPAQLSVELNGESTHPLYLFANPPFSPDPEIYKDALVFERGLYEPGEIQLQSDQTVILEPGAVVRGYFVAEHAENIRIIGRGVVDGSAYSSGRSQPANRKILLKHCRDVSIEGIFIVNNPTWTIEPMFCRNVRIENVKILNHQFGSDGIDMVGCQDVHIDDSFIRANDDCVVIKTWGGDEKYPKTPKKGVNVSNITVRNSVFWNMSWGNALEIGFELRADSVRQLLFENCDVIHVDRGAVMSIHNGDYATVCDVTYRDIRVENADHKLIDLAVFLSQYSLDRHPDPAYREKNYLHGAWDGVQKVPEGKKQAHAEHRGHIKNIVFENISILDGPLPFSVIAGYNQKHAVENVVIDNLRVYGNKVETRQEAKLNVANARKLEIR
ncbi:MAG: glycosyl hydrolase family 28 protein [candidate division KSB1 bacterium]|nr:glycosyl hydrolase family 28 protein [candidate division KSB1 bacterium]